MVTKSFTNLHQLSPILRPDPSAKLVMGILLDTSNRWYFEIGLIDQLGSIALFNLLRPTLKMSRQSEHTTPQN
jgi:hypothetical protein